MDIAFTPLWDLTKSITIAATSAAATSVQIEGERQFRIYNAASETVFVTAKIGSDPTASLTTSTPIPSGVVEVLTVSGVGVVHFAAIGTGATGTLYITPGDGI